MLQQFTWQQFLVAACILSFIWYVVVLFFIYRKEAKRMFEAKTKAEPLPHRWENEEEFESEPDEDDLVGKPALPEGMKNVGSDQFSFVGNDAAKVQSLGLVPDVLEELKSIFNILEKEDGTKQDFYSLLQLVKAKYGAISSHPQIGSINGFIREHVSFHLSNQELEDLWD